MQKVVELNKNTFVVGPGRTFFKGIGAISVELLLVYIKAGTEEGKENKKSKKRC